MARPKKVSGSLRAQPVTLHADDIQALADRLRLPVGAARDSMTNEVEKLLTNHHLFSERNAESAARKVATFKPLLEQALALQKGIKVLSPALRMELCDSPDAPALSDGEIERMCRVLAIATGRNQERADAAKDGRPSSEETLRQTVWGLQHVFVKHYKGPAGKRTDEEMEFVHLALSSAGICHPDPSSNRSRLAALMQTTQTIPDQSDA